MSPDTAQALKESALAWRIRAAGVISKPNAENCPLCKLHNRPEQFITFKENDARCLQCPIYLKTGERFCEGTPYKHYNNYTRWKIRNLSDKDIAEMKIWADQEYRFLLSLLPEGVEPYELPESLTILGENNGNN